MGRACARMSSASCCQSSTATSSLTLSPQRWDATHLQSESYKYIKLLNLTPCHVHRGPGGGEGFEQLFESMTSSTLMVRAITTSPRQSMARTE